MDNNISKVDISFSVIETMIGELTQNNNSIEKNIAMTFIIQLFKQLKIPISQNQLNQQIELLFNNGNILDTQLKTIIFHLLPAGT